MEEGLYSRDGLVVVLAPKDNTTQVYSLDGTYKGLKINEPTIVKRLPKEIKEEEIFSEGKKPIKVGELGDVVKFI